MVFSAEHSFCVSQIVKSLFRGPFPKHPFSNQKKVPSLGFPHVSAETPISVVFGDLSGHKKLSFSKTDGVNENALFCFPKTNSVFLNQFSKMPFQQKKILFPTTQKRYKLFSAYFFCEMFLLHGFIVFLFLCPKTITKHAYFSKALIWHPDNLQQKTPLQTICDFTNTKIHFKIWGKTSK